MAMRRSAPARKPAARRRVPGTVATKQKRPAVLRSRAGYTIRAASDAGGELVTLRAPDGRLCLKIALLPDGPVVEAYGQSLRLASAGELRLDCERLAINVRQEATIQAGELRQTVAGDVRVSAGGAIESEASRQHLRARVGDIALEANDDVCLDGERVRLNSPKSLPPATGELTRALGPLWEPGGEPPRSIWAADDGPAPPPRKRRR
jgi:hypothetical protein